MCQSIWKGLLFIKESTADLEDINVVRCPYFLPKALFNINSYFFEYRLVNTTGQHLKCTAILTQRKYDQLRAKH